MTFPLNALTVRWSLEAAPEGVEQTLADYIAEASHARFSGMDGLRFKTWRMVPGTWFEGAYVFASDEARAAFQAAFETGAAASPVSGIVGSAPVLIEPCVAQAVAEGGAGFTPYARG